MTHTTPLAARGARSPRLVAPASWLVVCSPWLVARSPRLVAIALCLVAVDAQAQDPQKTMRAAPRIGPIVVDGAVTEEAWAGASLRTDFVERTPSLRAEPPEGTELRVLVDRSALFVSLVCHDSQPDAVAARTLTRDSFDLFSDDAVSLKLDPAFDRRTTLGFALSAAGARMDYRGINESEWQVEFDGVWEGAVQRTPGGWSAELRIPWPTLGVDPDRPPERIGLDISRDHARRAATYDWAVLAPPYGPLAASRYGQLEGLGEAIASAGGETSAVWSVDLYSRGGVTVAEGEAAEWEATGGADARALLAPGLWGLLTVNTDFAQVEPDDQVVNLSRFDLFLPEKRDFFLNAGDLFAFGDSGATQPYYSRRIGLAGGRPLPIAGGVQLAGRPAEGLQVGLLDVITQPGAGQPWTSNLVARLQQDVGGDTVLGAMLTHRQSLDDGSDHNAVVGLDAAFRGAGTPLLIQTFGLLTVTGEEARAGTTSQDGTVPAALAGAAQIDLAWRGELVRPSAGYAWIGHDARTDLGFLYRTGVQKAYGGLEIQPRIGGGIETVTVAATGSVTGEEADFAVLDWRGVGSVTVDWDAGFSLGATAQIDAETVPRAFQIGRETEIAAGSYESWRGVLSASLPATWPVSASVSGAFGEFYGGLLGTVSGDLVARAGSLLRLQAGATGDFARFDSEVAGFDSVTVNGRVGLGFSPDLGLDVYGGYGLLAESVVLQARLRWTWRSASDLFVVYEADLGDNGARALFNSLQIKLTARVP